MASVDQASSSTSAGPIDSCLVSLVSYVDTNSTDHVDCSKAEGQRSRYTEER